MKCPALALRAALLLGGCRTVHGVLLTSHAAVESYSSSSMRSLMRAYGEKIRLRFSDVDADGDGVVSFAEMQQGFGHEPVHAGEEVLAQMMAECADGERGARSCTRAQLERSLDAWVASHEARASLSLLQQDAAAGFKHVDIHEAAQEKEQPPCGPSAAEVPAPGLEGIKCTVKGAKCFKWGGLAAWSLNDVCHKRACICEPGRETKRLAKLGVMGAGGVTAARNFSDPGDELLPPSCGSDWQSLKIVGIIGDIHQEMDSAEEAVAKEALQHYTVEDYTFSEIKEAATEVALYKSAHHRVSSGDPHQKVCMISWQPTRSLGDWVTNFLVRTIPFRYGPDGTTVMIPKGIEITYASVRDRLKRTFEEQCCSPEFQADKLVISGHSHGGAMAELHAVDVVSNWKCGGRDLGARDVSVVLVAPHKDFFKTDAINKIFSCNDASACLAGSVVTLVTENDFVGDDKMSLRTNHPPIHPSKVYRLPCPPQPPGAHYKNKTSHRGLAAERRENEVFDRFWCHGMFNYVHLVEEKLVGEAGWGSSCDGSCGDPNRMVQCNQWAIMGRTGCSYAQEDWLKPPTPCPSSRWIPSEERCDCHFDLCTDLTNHGCAA